MLILDISGQLDFTSAVEQVCCLDFLPRNFAAIHNCDLSLSFGSCEHLVALALGRGCAHICRRFTCANRAHFSAPEFCIWVRLGLGGRHEGMLVYHRLLVAN